MKCHFQRIDMTDVANLRDKFALVDTYWDPKIVGELNGQHVKLAKLLGEFVWHAHEQEEELFLVVSGSLDMRFRDRTVTVQEGEFIIVPHGVEHCPFAPAEVHVLLFEPVGTVNTGGVHSGRTIAEPERI